MIIYKYKILFELSESNYWLYKFEILALLGKLSPFLMVFSLSFITDISHFKSVIDGLLNSLEEQKKERDWENSN